MKTEIEFQILEDGTISVITGKIADTVHLQADQLLDELNEMIGGEVKRKENPENPGKVFWKNRDVRRVNGKMKIVRKA